MSNFLAIVIEEADSVGSTSQMINFVRERQPQAVAMITECSMSDNVAQELPHIDFVRPCTMCPHMKKITLGNILLALEENQFQVEVPEDIAIRARRSVERMLEVGRGANR